VYATLRGVPGTSGTVYFTKAGYNVSDKITIEFTSGSGGGQS
jgi:hypothetical protein